MIIERLYNSLVKKNQAKLYNSECRKNRRILLYILIGYKENLYDAVFKRLDLYLDIDADVCLVTSGKYDEKLCHEARKRNWCYVSSKRNNVSIAQNCVISFFPSAELIIKMDEDIFVTSGVFRKLLESYRQAHEKYKRIAFVAPIFNINGYTTIKLLEIFNKKEEYEKTYGKLSYGYGRKKAIIESNLSFTKNIWADFPLDNTNKIFEEKKLNYDVCPIYFSIGLILFTRKFYNKIGYFLVLPGNSLGVDELQMNRRCRFFGYKRIICQTAFCGHFSYGPTSEGMKKFQEEKPNIFK